MKTTKGNRSLAPSWEVLILLVILMLGAILRFLYLNEIMKNPDFSSPILDAGFHDYWARGMTTGKWALFKGYTDPLINSTPYQKPPGYSYFMAMVYFFFSPGYVAIRIVQMGLGLINCVLAYIIGKRWFGSIVGLIFASFMSFYWVFIYFEGELYAPVLIVFFALLLIRTLSLWTEKISFLRCFTAGIILGLSAIVKPNILLFALAASGWLAWILYRRGTWRFFPLALTGFATGIALIVMPVTIRNYVVSKELVLISSNAGLNFLVGNNQLADGVTPTVPDLKELTGLESWTPFHYPLLIHGLENKFDRPFKYSDAEEYWIKATLVYIRTYPLDFLNLIIRKAVLFWSPQEIGNPTEIHYARLNSRLLQNIPGNFPFILSLSVLGLTLLFFDLRTKSPNPAVLREARVRQYEATLLILLFIVIYFASLMPFLVSSRFRVPVIPFLLLFGSYGLYKTAVFCIYRNFKNVAYCLTIFIFLYVFTATNWIESRPDAARWHYNRGVAYEAKGEIGLATKEYSRALLIKPTYAEAYYGLGNTSAREGKTDIAVMNYLKALKIKPEFADALGNLGATLLEQGKLHEAAAHFSKILKIKPYDAYAYYDMGLVLMNLNKIDEAIAQFSRSLQLKPNFAEAHNNLGRALTVNKKFDEAISHYHKALQIKPNDMRLYSNLGNVLVEQGKFDEAIASYIKALRIKPDDEIVHFNMGIALSKQGKHKNATIHFNEALRIKSTFTNARYNRKSSLREAEKNR